MRVRVRRRKVELASLPAVYELFRGARHLEVALPASVLISNQIRQIFQICGAVVLVGVRIAFRRSLELFWLFAAQIQIQILRRSRESRPVLRA